MKGIGATKTGRALALAKLRQICNGETSANSSVTRCCTGRKNSAEGAIGAAIYPKIAFLSL
jgi:hypothetical protein